MSDRVLRCSFCDKPRGDVKHMVAGDNAAICNECVFLAIGHLLLNTDKVKPATLPVPELPTSLTGRLRAWYDACCIDPPYAKGSPGALLFGACADHFRSKR